MRIVIDGRRLSAGRTGVGRYLEVLLKGWALDGGPPAETLVVLHDPHGRPSVPDVPRLNAEVRGVGWPGLAWERFALARDRRPGDVLFAPTNLIPANWRGPSVLVLFDTLLWSSPTGFTRRDRIWFGARIRKATRRASLIVVPSRATYQGAIEHLRVDAEKLRLIEPAVDPDFRPRPPEHPWIGQARTHLGLGDSRFFLFVGKPSIRRHLPDLLAGFALHRRAHPASKLVLVGPGTRMFAGAEGIVAAGLVDEPILHGLMSDAVAMVYPSSDEGFGLPVLEALASGCPAIVSGRGAILESGGDAAYDVGEIHAASIAEALDRMVEDPAERSARIARGLEHASRFSVATFADRIGKILLEVGG